MLTGKQNWGLDVAVGIELELGGVALARGSLNEGIVCAPL